MGRATNSPPTEAELAILRVLWERGGCTVRDVHEALGGDGRSRYTTTLKQLQVMTDKGLVERDSSERSHVYTAATDEASTEKSIVKSFLDRMFDGSVQKMVLHALDSGVTAEELQEIKRRLKQWENRQ